MTDNRTNESNQIRQNDAKHFAWSDEQVEAAARAMWELRKRPSDPVWVGGELDHGIKEIYRQDARAALVSAQGAAPQAESEELAWYKVAAKHSADSMAEARATLQMFADRVDPFVFDELSSVLDDQPLDYETGDVIGEAAPVLPSSTVDEDALAEVVCLALNHRDGGEECADDYRVALAVAEWLKRGK